MNRPWQIPQFGLPGISQSAMTIGDRSGQPGGSTWCFFIRRSGDVDKDRSVEPAGECHRTGKLARLEAALFVADGPLSPRRLVQAATLADTDEARLLVAALNEFYDSAATAFRIERAASGYQMLTRPEFAPWLNTLHECKAELRLSPPAMETLTIVAYRQPITRADIEAIRGVQSVEILKQLMERSLVRIAGEEDSLGRPFLYETTRKFLESFGLQSLADLPLADELRLVDKNGEPAEAATAG
ncbi:MAG: SMC-Scp complex subunit ScpB [Planctomycetaceae bacterium]